MSSREFALTSADGVAINCFHWRAQHPRAIVVIAHGAAEHGARYAHFAQALNARGYEVFAEDHRGHGVIVASKWPLHVRRRGERVRPCYRIIEIEVGAVEKHPRVARAVHAELSIR